MLKVYIVFIFLMLQGCTFGADPIRLSAKINKESQCAIRPTTFDTSNTGGAVILLGRSKLSMDQIDRYSAVLKHYGVEFEADKGKIYISCDMYADFGLLVSISKKAHDDKFLSSLKTKR